MVNETIDEFGELHKDHYYNKAPPWFMGRMLTDVWSFGLLMCDGTVIGIQAIEHIKQTADGTIWIDVTLMDSISWPDDFTKKFVAPTSRLEASINTSHIMAAFELADT